MPSRISKPTRLLRFDRDRRVRCLRHGSFGDGVNVAPRLGGLAEPGGICVSARVQEDAAGRLDLAFEDLGEQALKNITRPVRGLDMVLISDQLGEPNGSSKCRYRGSSLHMVIAPRASEA